MPATTHLPHVPTWSLHCSACDAPPIDGAERAGTCPACGQPLLARYAALPPSGTLAPRWDLWRYQGSACSGTGRKYAEYLTQSGAFNYTPQSSASLAFLSVRLPVNVPSPETTRSYVLDDNIVLRNSTRS